MAKQKKATTEKKEKAKLSMNEKFSSFLKDNEKHHYNFEEEKYYKVPSGSLTMDLDLNGGLTPGLHRFVGVNEGGKSSQALLFMKNFLDKFSTGGRGFLIKAEGRLSPEMAERSGVKFVHHAEDWVDGTCFVFDCNIYETAVEAMRTFVYENEEEKKFFFLLDSVDGLISKNDIDKKFEESSKVAGGAVIASNFMKRVSIAMQKRGHIAVFVSQVRADIQLDTYSRAPIRQTTATGGNALLHFANFILEFQPRFTGDMILEDNSKDKKYDPVTNKYLGHFAKVVVKKSPNEKTNAIIKYPIKYGRVGGKSVWVEKELVDFLRMWNFAILKGSWFSFSDDFREEMKEKGIDLPASIQGENKLFSWIEKDEKLKTVLFDYFKQIILSE